MCAYNINHNDKIKATEDYNKKINSMSYDIISHIFKIMMKKKLYLLHCSIWS